MCCQTNVNLGPTLETVKNLCGQWPVPQASNMKIFKYFQYVSIRSFINFLIFQFFAIPRTWQPGPRFFFWLHFAIFSLGLLAQAFHVPLFVALLWRQSCQVAGIPSFKADCAGNLQQWTVFEWSFVFIIVYLHSKLQGAEKRWWLASPSWRCCRQHSQTWRKP